MVLRGGDELTELFICRQTPEYQDFLQRGRPSLRFQRDLGDDLDGLIAFLIGHGARPGPGVVINFTLAKPIFQDA